MAAGEGRDRRESRRFALFLLVPRPQGLRSWGGGRGCAQLRVNDRVEGAGEASEGA